MDKGRRHAPELPAALTQKGKLSAGGQEALQLAFFSGTNTFGLTTSSSRHSKLTVAGKHMRHLIRSPTLESESASCRQVAEELRNVCLVDALAVQMLGNSKLTLPTL